MFTFFFFACLTGLTPRKDSMTKRLNKLNFDAKTNDPEFGLVWWSLELVVGFVGRDCFKWVLLAFPRMRRGLRLAFIGSLHPVHAEMAKRFGFDV